MLRSTRPSFLTLALIFFHVTATTQIYTLSLHDALPIFRTKTATARRSKQFRNSPRDSTCFTLRRSEEHTSELQSLRHLVCRLLLEKKNEGHPHHVDSAVLHHGPRVARKSPLELTSPTFR